MLDLYYRRPRLLILTLLLILAAGIAADALFSGAGKRLIRESAKVAGVYQPVGRQTCHSRKRTGRSTVSL